METINQATKERLESFMQRIERLDEERATLVNDIRDVYGEAKGEGFDTKAMRKIVRERRLSEAERQEEVHILDTYRHALGMAQSSFEFAEEEAVVTTLSSRGRSVSLVGSGRAQTDLEDFTSQGAA